MKKKSYPSLKDKNDWAKFTENLNNIVDKENEISNNNNRIKKLRKLDLHGFSLDDANKEVKKFIFDSFNKNYEKILIITGKGSRSKSHNNPYISSKLSVLKHSIPEFIENHKDLKNKIIKISKADLKDGGEGALYIFLKKSKV